MRKLSASVLAKVLLSLGGIIAVAYLGLCVLLRFWQTRLIFFPSPMINTTPADVGLPYEEVWLPVGKQQIHGWWIPATTTAPTLLYLHGNGSNIGDVVGRAVLFHQIGLSVLLMDYRGYGHSLGSFPTEVSVYEDAEAAWTYLRTTRRLKHQDIVLYGHSLGGAIAIDLAVRHPKLSGVIVEASFTSIQAMLNYLSPYQLLPVSWILTQHFDSLAKVRSLQTPVLFIHGTADETIPAQMSRDLFAAAPEPKQLLLIPKAGHNNIAKLGGTTYLRTVQEFVYQVHKQKD